MHHLQASRWTVRQTPQTLKGVSKASQRPDAITMQIFATTCRSPRRNNATFRGRRACSNLSDEKEHALAIGKRSNLGISQLSSIGTERSPVSPFVYEETSKSSSIFPARLEVSVGTRNTSVSGGSFRGKPRRGYRGRKLVVENGEAIRSAPEGLLQSRFPFR